MTYGVVAGKFWPFHKGHEYLLHTAAVQCDHLDILLVGRPDEFPAPAQRALAIYESLAGFDIQVHIVGDIETNDGTEESSQVWAQYTPAILGYTPDVVFSSEEYGVRWAGYMNVPHIMVDLERRTYPVSGTEIRNNFYANSKFIPDATKAQVLPRIVVMGSESTGTTTLATALGRQFKTNVVPEFGRLIAEDYKKKNGVAPPLDFWTDQQFRLVAHGQNALEERYAKSANGILICDTDSLATAVWYERYHQAKSSMYFDEVGMLQAQKHHLYIVTSPTGIPWEDDGTRDGPDQREWMHESFVFMAKQAHRRYGVPWVVVEGSRHERLIHALNKIQN